MSGSDDTDGHSMDDGCECGGECWRYIEYAHHKAAIVFTHAHERSGVRSHKISRLRCVYAVQCNKCDWAIKDETCTAVETATELHLKASDFAQTFDLVDTSKSCPLADFEAEFEGSA